MRTSIFFLLSSLMVIGCGGSEDGGTVAEADTGTAEETSATDTGSTTDDTGSTTDDTGSTTEETGGETGGDTGGAGDAIVTDAPADAPGAPTFTQVYAILSAKCASCHTTGPGSGNLDMKNKANAYTELVGKKAEGGACAAGGMTRVVAGNADNSLLIHKLTKMDSEVCGDPMPQGRPRLSATEIATIRGWINAGAKND